MTHLSSEQFLALGGGGSLLLVLGATRFGRTLLQRPSALALAIGFAALSFVVLPLDLRIASHFRKPYVPPPPAMVTAWVLAQDTAAGTVLTAAMLKPVQVAETYAKHLVLDPKEAEGKPLRVRATAGTALARVLLAERLPGFCGWLQAPLVPQIDDVDGGAP